jgi:hypothetical protein
MKTSTPSPPACSSKESCGPCSRGLCPGTILLAVVLIVQGGIALWRWLVG